MVKRDVRLAGIVQGQEEIDAVNRVLYSEPAWHVSGPECSALQNELAAKLGMKYCVVVNSGSSANLLAMAVLNIPEGTTVLTSACGFPATLNPILHLNQIPFLVDYDLATLNISLDEIEKALKTHYIKTMIVAHTLGSSLDMDRLMGLVKKHDITLIEDCCEALGTMFDNKHVGSFGTVSTVSFYSSHQISGFGGGGALLTNEVELFEKAKSLRDWGKQNVREGYLCTKLNTTVDGIPYDQQYTYSSIGYNMRFPDANCAYARAQLDKLNMFIGLRQKNYMGLNFLLKESLADDLHFMQWPLKASPAFFGYPLVLKEEGLRDKLVEHLEENGVHVRLFFAGNILRHDAYKNIPYVANSRKFPVADYLMRNSLFCGCWPGLTEEDMIYTADVIKEFFKNV
jgi:CDP-6-deoxy-D-xylo-4-hexulose-3-dehydrase